jgi:hypothetical protein
MTVQFARPPIGPSADETRKMWSIFAVGAKNPISLRAIWPKRAGPSEPPVNVTFTAADFPDIDDRRAAFEADALRLNQQGYNVYVVMNPIRPGFSGKAVSDRDIEFRDLLLIDLDRAGKTDCPASDDEIEAAAQLADKIAARLQAQGWDEPLRMMSGNGVHLYLVLDQLPNDDASRDKVQALLGELALEFNTDAVKVDTTVYNAGRITKVPGTVARKGEESEGRPYRMARVL